MSALRFFSRASDESIILATYHPVGCLTWHWSLSLKRNAIGSNVWRLWHRDTSRRGQWHDFYRLPFGWWLIVSRQDYHIRGAA